MIVHATQMNKEKYDFLWFDFDHKVICMGKRKPIGKKEETIVYERTSHSSQNYSLEIYLFMIDWFDTIISFKCLELLHF